MIAEEILEALKARPRTCIHAEALEQIQEMTVPISGYGGTFWGKPEERWPAKENEIYKPVLTIRVDELPYIPKHLEDVALLNVFATKSFDPFADDGGVVVRVYDSLEGLIPLRPPHDLPKEFYKINWIEKVDYPDSLNLEFQLGQEIESEDWDEIQKVFDAYPNLSGVKLGGWPTQIQLSAVYFIVAGDPGYIGQIDWHEAYSFMDGGIGYLLWSEKFGYHTDGWTSS